MSKGKTGSRLIALLLAVLMLVAYMPMLGDAAYAEDGIPEISLDKTEYYEGESINVTCNLNGYQPSSSAWIAVVESNQNIDASSTIWYYPDKYDSNTVDIINGIGTDSSKGEKRANLVAGKEYKVFYVYDPGSAQAYVALSNIITFRIVEKPSTFLELYTDASATQTTSEYSMDDLAIYVRANSEETDEDRPWLGIYSGALTLETWSSSQLAMVWAYCEQPNGSQTAQYNTDAAVNMIGSGNYIPDANTNLIFTPGTYTAILFKSYNDYGPVAYKQFTITEGQEQPPLEGYELNIVPEETFSEDASADNRYITWDSDTGDTYKFYKTITERNKLTVNVKVPEEVTGEKAWVGLFECDETNYNKTAYEWAYVKSAEDEIVFDLSKPSDPKHDGGTSGYRKVVLFKDGGYTPACEEMLFIRPAPGGTTEAESLVYTGSAQTPQRSQVKVLKPNGSVYRDVYWDVIFDDENSTKVGTYTYTIKFKYTVGGSIKGEYKIVDSFADPTFEWAEDYSEATAIFESADPESEAFQEVPATVTKVETPATCKEAGKTVYTATVAAEDISFPITGTAPFTDTKTVEIPKKDHTPDEAVEENKVDATCTAEGSYDEVVYCKDCKAELSRTHKTIEKKAHTEEVIPAKEATCTATGLTEGKKCSVCGEVLVEQQEVPMKDHTPAEAVKEDGEDASCEAAGFHFDVVKCSVCGEEISRTKVEDPALGHDYQVVEGSAKAATFEEAGKEADKKCSRCGDVITGAEIPKLTAEASLSKTKFHYTGKVQKPEVKVAVNGTELDPKDFEVTIPSSKKIGAYKVTVKTTGDYAGFETTLNYQIAPKKVALKSVTKGTKSFTAKWAKQSATARKNIGGFQLRYSKDKTFKKGVYLSKKLSNKTTKWVKKSLKKKTKYYVQIRTYKKVNGKYYYSDWSKYKIVTTR